MYPPHMWLLIKVVKQLMIQTWVLARVKRALLIMLLGNFPSGPAVKTLLFLTQGREFDLWSGTKIPRAAWRSQTHK